MKNTKFFLIASVLFTFFLLSCDAPTPAVGPGQPDTGYGSDENYITSKVATQSSIAL